MNEDNDVLGDRPQAGEVSEVDSPSLANSEDLEGWGPHEPGLPERPDIPDGPEGSDLECSVPELGDGRLRQHECRGHWPYDRDVMIACSHEDAHLLGEWVISMKHPTVLLLISFL